MFCIKCGKRLPDESLFCPWCGSKVELITEEEANNDSNLLDKEETANNDNKIDSVPTSTDSESNIPHQIENDIENPDKIVSSDSNVAIWDKGLYRFLFYLLACVAIPVLILAVLHPVDEKFIDYITSVKGYGGDIAASLGGTVASYILFLPLIASLKHRISCKTDPLEISFVVLWFIYILDITIMDSSLTHSSLFFGMTIISFVVGIVLLIYDHFVKGD